MDSLEKAYVGALNDEIIKYDQRLITLTERYPSSLVAKKLRQEIDSHLTRLERIAAAADFFERDAP